MKKPNINTFKSYRTTNIEWMPQVPAHWGIDRLKWHISFSKNGAWGSDPNGTNEIVCIRVADFDRIKQLVVLNDPTIRSFDNRELNDRVLEKGDLLIEKSGGGENQLVGAVVEFNLEIEAVNSNFIGRLKIAGNQWPRYWVYFHSYLYSIKRNYLSINQTTGIQNLDLGSYLNEFACYPPFNEQQSIANFLDQKTKQIDDLIEQKEKLLALLTEKRTAIITQAVTKGLDRKAKMKDSGVEWLGEVPEHWNANKLKFISTILNSNVDKKSVEGEREVRLCNYVDVYYNDEITSAIDFMIATCSDEEYLKFSLKAGDVLITKDSESPDDIGIPSIVKENLTDLVCGYHLSMIRPKNDRINGGFLNYFLRSILSQSTFEVQANGVTRFGLPLHSIKSHLIPLPPIDEQGVITEYLDTVVKRIAEVIIATADSIEKLKEYRSSIVTSAVTGQIDVRNEVVA